jgi:hypothetical protein
LPVALPSAVSFPPPSGASCIESLMERFDTVGLNVPPDFTPPLLYTLGTGAGAASGISTDGHYMRAVGG